MATQDSLGPQFYHGTNAQLNPGDTLLPRNDTKLQESWPGNKDPKDKIWVTSNPTDAYKFAQQASFSRGGKPSVYTVEPTSRRASAHFNAPHGLVEQYTAAHAKVLSLHPRPEGE